MQVIASKDAAIEDLMKQLEKQLAMETVNAKQIKVCGPKHMYVSSFMYPPPAPRVCRP